MNLELFKKDGLKIRALKDENNEPLFCLSDVCKILELTNPSRVKEYLITEFGEDDVTHTYPIEDSLGVTQNVTFITEPQLYYLINSSGNKNARPFRMWVIKEILLHQEALELGLKLLEENEKLELENVNLKNEAKENAALIHFANRIKDTNDAILIRDFAKILYEKNKIEIGEKNFLLF